MQKTNNFKLLVSLIFLFLSFNFQLQAQSELQSTLKDTLIVGVAGSEPFVFENNVDRKGIAVNIWEDLASEEEWNYKYVNFSQVDEALLSLKKNELDLVVGPISITSRRLEDIKFSQPFYNSSLTIVSRNDKLDLWQKIKPFFSAKLLMAVLVFLIILAFVGTLLWYAERKKSPEQFSSDPIHGIGTGMWLAIVTMSTTGYGDKAPITLAGRIIAGSWMVISIIFATSMVAGIASTLTLTSLGTSTITNIEQLKNKKAATISGSPSEAFLREYNTKVVIVDDLDDGFSKLKNKEVEAVVYDRPQLLYYLNSHNEEDLHMAKAEYYKLGYGFAFPLNSPLTYKVNRGLLELAEDQEIKAYLDTYLGKDE
ncbi:transporter substrate-binding domain-containing protein [Xanthomarina sp. F1114]|uniref:transporter substrate-binding domain-containing protein n=1 Tax=Xanthomarina sp. F1114 TaxID=2996019 RepID=UPI00225E02D9|nr:transporter substrate-binding domain-containing protein [Xanthomarina sp. F1114]MCX7546724.1 transporter substrate-binding domain-containing protein [Xanthomarina sp. F1114]